MHLRLRPDRGVVGLAGKGEQQRCLLGAEDLCRPKLRRAVDPHAGGLPAPALGPPALVGEIDEGLAGEEALAYVGNSSFYTWLVSRSPDPSRVDDEAPGLGVLEERVVEPRCHLVGLHDNLAHVVGDRDREDTTEEEPGRPEAGDHVCRRLGEGEPHVAVPRVAGGEDERPADAPAFPVGEKPHPPEVDLQLGPRRRVGDPHGELRSASGAEALDTEADEGPIRDDGPAAGEQLVRLHHREILVEEGPDGLLLAEEQPPGLAVAVRSGRAHRLADPADQLLGELGLVAVAHEPGCDPRRDVAPGGLAVDAGSSGGGSFTLPTQPPSQHFFDLDHRHLPEHGHPPLDDEVPSRTAVRPEVVGPQVVP